MAAKRKAKKAASKAPRKSKASKVPKAPVRSTRTRPLNKHRPEKAERVKHIIEMMAAGDWQTGRSGPELAKQWDIKPGTVEFDAAEASRFIKGLFSEEDKDLLRARFLLEVESDKQLCRKMESFQALKGLHELTGKTLGLFVERRELTGKNGGPIETKPGGIVIMPPLDEMPPEEPNDPGDSEESGDDPE